MNFIQELIYRHKAKGMAQKRFQKDYVANKKEVLATRVADLNFTPTVYVDTNFKYATYNYEAKGHAPFLSEDKLSAFSIRPFDVKGEDFEVSFFDFKEAERRITLVDMMKGLGREKDVSYLGEESILIDGNVSTKDTYKVTAIAHPYQYEGNKAFYMDRYKTEPFTDPQDLADLPLKRVRGCYRPNSEKLSEKLNKANAYTVMDLVKGKKWRQDLHELDRNTVRSTLLLQDVHVDVLQMYREEAYQRLCNNHRQRDEERRQRRQDRQNVIASRRNTKMLANN